MTHRRKELIGAVLVVVAGCDRHLGCEPVLRTTGAQLELLAPDTIVGACDSIRDVGPVLVGTRVCPTLRCSTDVPGCDLGDDERLDSALVTECFVPAVQGPATLDADCLVVEDAGDIVWTFEAQACAANDQGYAPTSDGLTLPGVTVDRVTARLESPGDAFALRALDPGPVASFPEDARIVPGGVVQVLADTEVPLAIVLDHPDHDKPVAWNPSAWTVELLTDAGDPIDARLSFAGLLVVNIPDDVEAEVTVVQGDVRLPAGRVRGVADDELASLEVAAGYAPGDDDGRHGPPIGARAIFRTDDRAPVFGVPVAWEVTEGAFPAWRGEEEDWGPDYVALMDEDGLGCHKPPKRDPRTFHGTVVATHGDLEAEVEFEWTETPEDASLGEKLGNLVLGDKHENSELCEGPGFPAEGCGCATTTAPGWAVAAPLLVIVFRPRRRRRTL